MSADGLELMFAVNTYAYYALMRGLLPDLRANGPSAVVNVASTARDQTWCVDTQGPDWQWTRRPYVKQCAYASSKAAECMLTWFAAAREEERAQAAVRAGDAGNSSGAVVFNAVHPGNRWSSMNVVREADGHRTLLGQLTLATYTLYMCCDTAANVVQRVRWLSAHAPLLGVSGTYWSMETGWLNRESVQLPRRWTAEQGARLWRYLDGLI